MSSQIAIGDGSLIDGPVPLETPQGGSRSFLEQAFRDAFRSRTAKASALWVCILIFAAVFAPLLANSYPLLLKMDGRWSSPFLRYLTWVDATLLTLALAATIVLPRVRPRWPKKLAILTGVAGVSALLFFLLLHPPQNVLYQQYRQAQREGRVEFALHAPVPYSAMDHLRDRPEERLTAPSVIHWMGTDINGADVTSRMIHASRVALSIGFVSTGIAVIIGVIIGGMMGYFAGKVDMFGMRLIEIFEAIPTIFLLITIVAVFGHNLYILMVIIGVTSWTGHARFLRAEFLSLRHQDFVQAAVAAGLPVRSILFRHMLPNGITPVLISASFSVASAVMMESTLSFLDLGVVDEPSWGSLLNQSIGAGGSFLWWLATYPGLAIFLTVLSYNLIGEALHDALDPKLKRV